MVSIMNLTIHGVFFDGLIQIIGDGGMIGLNEKVSPSIDQRTTNSR